MKTLSQTASEELDPANTQMNDLEVNCLSVEPLNETTTPGDTLIIYSLVKDFEPEVPS